MSAESFRTASRGGRPSRQKPVDDLPYQPPTTMAEVEERMFEAQDQLMDLVEENKHFTYAAAEARADWEAHLSTIIVQVHAAGEKTAADVREAIARVTPSANGVSGNELYRRYKLTEATAQSTGRAMKAIESIQDSLRTICSNIRAVS